VHQKEFWKDAIKNKEFRPTRSIEEHNENAKNKLEEQLRKSKVNSEQGAHMQTNNAQITKTSTQSIQFSPTKSSNNTKYDSLNTSLMSRLRQIASNKTH
jgi:hypothetical protein